jgi:hypothetical protein
VQVSVYSTGACLADCMCSHCLHLFLCVSRSLFGKGLQHLILFIHSMYMYGMDGHVAHLAYIRNVLQNFGQA